MNTDISVQRTRLAELKLEEAELQMEAANIERDLAAKEGEILKVRAQIDQLNRTMLMTPRATSTSVPGGTSIVAAEHVGTAPKGKKHGRPRLIDIQNAGGSSSQPPLGTLIDKILSGSKQGISKEDLVGKIIASGYVSVSGDFGTMIDQALYRLKKKDKLYRNPDSLLFFKKEAA